MKKTLVLGASDNPERYAYLAIKKLRAHGHEVTAIGNREAMVDDVPILTGQPQLEGIHTVTLYLNPFRQEEYYDYLFSLQPKRIIFNPGTENAGLLQRAKLAGIEVLDACTLVMLSTGQF